MTQLEKLKAILLMYKVRRASGEKGLTNHIEIIKARIGIAELTERSKDSWPPIENGKPVEPDGSRS